MFGAICSETGETARAILPWCNIEAMSLYLAEIARRVRRASTARCWWIKPVGTSWRGWLCLQTLPA